MKVLHAIHDFLPRHQAGAEIYAFHLCRELSQRHSVGVLCADYDPSRPHGTLTRRTFEGLPVMELINNWIARSFADTYCSPLLNHELDRALASFQPDVLHLHSLHGLSLDLPLLARRRQIPVVATLHDYTLLCPAGGQRLRTTDEKICEAIDPARCAQCFAASPYFALMMLGRLAGRRPASLRHAATVARLLRRSLPRSFGPLAQALRRLPTATLPAEDLRQRLAHVLQVFETVDHFIAPSRALGDTFIGFGLPRDKLTVSCYGQPPLPRPPAPSETSGAGPLRVGFVGTLTRHKGAHVLLEALSSLPEDRYQVRFFGDQDTFPEYSARLRRDAGRLPIRFSGPFTGQERAEVYAWMDVLVVPSIWPENSPLVIHEAFSAGVPVLGARIGGIPELVKDGEGGLLFNCGDPADLGRALGSLIHHPDRLRALQQSVPRVKSMAEDAQQWEALYNEVAGPRGSRPATPKRALCSAAPLPQPPKKVSILLLTRSRPDHSLVQQTAELVELLKRVRQQETDFPMEVVAVDSGSSNSTVALLKERTDKLLQIPPEAFNHGLTRNLGLAHCSGELVALLVQDALPASNCWLAELVAPLAADEGVAGSWARQLPRPDASPITRLYMERGINTSDIGRESFLGATQEFDQLPPWEQYLQCSLDNVCSCVRRSVWQRHPFVETAFAEDLIWAKEVLLGGHKLVYAAKAEVIHSHDRSAGYELRRTYLAHQQLRRLFQLRAVPSALHLPTAMAGTLASHIICLARQPHFRHLSLWEVKRAMALAFALPMGQYLGALSADRGWSVLRAGDV